MGVHGYAAVLIDVVDSRQHLDRESLQRSLTEVAAVVEAMYPALDPFTPTVGDELQGTYATVVSAMVAAVDLRLRLTGTAEIRTAIGWGDIVVHDPDRTPFGQDGPAWWEARAALDEMDAATVRSSYPARMRLAGLAPDAADSAGPSDLSPSPRALPPPTELTIPAVSALRALTTLLDRSLATLDATEAAIVLGDREGVSTAEIARRVGLTASAVSQRRGRNHLREIVVALDQLEGIRT